MDSKFVALPTDIHISLLALVDIHDVISVRRTCKSLRALSNERIVWLNMLRKECAEHHLFYPERTLQTMTTRELEDAACGSSKWLSMSSRNTRAACIASALSSRRIPLFDEHLSTPFIGPPENRHYFQVHSWYLVPGGKYLVTWSSLSLSVWDLALNHDCDSPQPLSTVSVPCWAEASYLPATTMTVQPTANGEGLTIMTFFHRQQQTESSPEWFICQIYDISMNVSSPMLCRVASLEGPKDKKTFPCAIQGEFVAMFIQPRELAIWNYREDTWASWSVAGRSFSDVCDILIQPTYVALLHHDKIAVWSIPPLTKVNNSYSRFQRDASTPIGAVVTCDIPAQPIRRYRWASPKPWRLGALSSRSLPIIGTKTHVKQDWIYFDSFELFVSKDLSTASISKRLPTVVLDQTIARVQLRAEYSNLACVSIFGRNALRIHPFSCSQVGDNDPINLTKPHIVTIPMSPIQDIPDFCPASGRIAFMQDKDYAAIHVWDLF